MHTLGHCLTECLLCTDMSVLHEVHVIGYMPVKLNISAMVESWKVYLPCLGSVEGPGILGSIYTNGKSWDQQLLLWAEASTA